MHFNIKLVSIWKTVTIAVILNMTLLFSVIILLHGQYMWLGIILEFPILFGSMIISMYLCSRIRSIEIINGILTIDKSKPIQIDQIDWYNASASFLMDGIRIKTKQGKNYYFSTINLTHKDPNFDKFKDILINKTLDHKIEEKTTHQLYVENKFLRHSATVAMILYVCLILMTIFTDFKIDKIKLFYTGMIIIGTFISTRK
jgi:hypothetical protein